MKNVFKFLVPLLLLCQSLFAATITVTADKNIDDLFAPMMVGVATGGTVGASCPLNAATGTWTARTLPTGAWNSVCSGKNMFVAVAGGPSTTAGYSLDGVTWSAATLPASKEWKSVIFAGDRFVAVSYGTTDTAYSFDGVTWVAGGAMPSAANWQSVTYGENTLVATSATDAGAYSTNGGVSWSSSTLPESLDWRRIAYGAGTFVAVSYGDAHAATSADGITWDTIRDMPSSANWSSICYGNGLFVAVAYNTNKAATSADGISWAADTLSATANWNSVIYAPSNTALGAASVPMFYATSYGSNVSSYAEDPTGTWTADTVSASGNWTSYAYVSAAQGDTLNINDGAIVTVNTDQTRYFAAINVTNGNLNITNTSTTTGIRFITGKITGANGNMGLTAIAGLGGTNVTGDWIELGTGDGSANQTFTYWTTDALPAAWIETTPSSGVYVPWLNITTHSTTNQYNIAYTDNSQMKYAGAGEMGHFFVQGQGTEPFSLGSTFKDQLTNVITFGDGTHGAVVPNGCKVRVPNISFTNGSMIQNVSTTTGLYYAMVTMAASGTFTADTVSFVDARLDATTAKTFHLKHVGMFIKPIITKCADVSLEDFALAQPISYVFYTSGIRTIKAPFYYNWINTYLNNAYVKDFYHVTTVVPDNVTGTAYHGFQYCNNLEVDGWNNFALNTSAGNNLLYLDYVNSSEISHLKLMGGCYRISNSTGTTVDDVEYLSSSDGKSFQLIANPQTNHDIDGNAFVDGQDYYYKFTQRKDVNDIIPMPDSGYYWHVKPFTPTLRSFPFWFGVTPGAARNDLYWGPASLYPFYKWEVFRDTAIIKTSAVTMTIADPCVVTWVSHGLSNGQPVTLTTSGTLATGLTAGTVTYYARSTDCVTPANEFWLYDSAAHAIAGGTTGRIATSGSQSGNHVCTTGSRLLDGATVSTVTYADTTAVNGTKYYYILRKHEIAGNVKDTTFCDSTSFEGTPLAIPTYNNYCLQSNVFSNASWTKTNITTPTETEKYLPAISTWSSRLAATGNATVTQNITGLTAGQTYHWNIMLSTTDSKTVKISAVSGATTVETTCALQQYWKNFEVTITIPVGQTSCLLTIGSSTSFTNGQIIYAGMSNFDIATNPQNDIATTTTQATGRLYHMLSRTFWNWRDRAVMVVPSIPSAATSSYYIYGAYHQGATASFTPSLSTMFCKYTPTLIHSYFLNNVNCVFSNFSHSTFENMYPGLASGTCLLAANCSNCQFLNWDFANTGTNCHRLVYTLTGSKDCLFANFTMLENKGYPYDASSTAGVPFYSDTSCSGMTYQNFYFGNYDIPIIGSIANNSLHKGIAGAYGEASGNVWAGGKQDSVDIAYASVFDTSFFESYTSATDGRLSIRFNGTTNTTSPVITTSGKCGFDATGKLYMMGTDAVVTMEWPYQLRGTNGFRNIAPFYHTTFWTSAVFSDLASKPICLKVEYDINNSGTWKVLNETNLSAEDVSDPFYFKVRFSIAGRTLEYDTETASFHVGDTVEGGTSGATGTVEEITDRGIYGQIRLSSVSGIFVNNDLIRRTQVAVTTAIASPGVVVMPAHNLTKGEAVVFTGGTLPTGCVSGTTYYARPDDTDTPTDKFWIYDSSAHAIAGGTTGRINFTGSESGTHYCKVSLALANIGTTYIDNTFPNAGTYIDALDIYTTVDQSYLYPTEIKTVAVNLSGMVAGSQLKVTRASDDSELYNQTLAGTTATFNMTVEGDVPIKIYLRKGSASAYYKPLYATGTVTLDAGFSATLTQIPDPIAASYPAGIASDWTINPSAKTITHTSGSTVYTVNELYSYLEDYFDSSSTVTLDSPMAAATSTVFETINGYTIPDASHEYLKGGAITEDAGNTLWSNLYTIGSLEAGTQLYIVQNGTTLTPWWSTGHIDVLVKVKTGGSLIDSGNVRVFAREFNDLYDHYLADLSGGGRNVAPLATTSDTNNQTASGTVATYNDITITQSAQPGKQIDDSDTPADYSWGVNANGHTVKEVYEYFKYVCQRGSTFSLSSVDGEKFRLINSLWSELRTAPLGTFAGGVFFGARGLWLENVAEADALNYILRADDDSTHQMSTPPVTQSVSITNLVPGSRVQIYDVTSNTELFNDIVAGTSTTWTDSGAATDSREIRLRISNCIGTTAYKGIDASIGTCGMTVATKSVNYIAAQEADTVYDTIGVDGSTVTECSISGSTIRIYVDDPDNTTSAQRIYSWFVSYLYTEAGIAEQDKDYVVANDSTHFTFDNSMKIINQDTSNPLNITGANIVPASGAATNVFDLSNGASIALNFNRVEGFAYSSGSGLSTEEHDAILSTKTTVDANLDAKSSDVLKKADDAAVLRIS